MVTAPPAKASRLRSTRPSASVTFRWEYTRWGASIGPCSTTFCGLSNTGTRFPVDAIVITTARPSPPGGWFKVKLCSTPEAFDAYHALNASRRLSTVLVVAPGWSGDLGVRRPTVTFAMFQCIHWPRPPLTATTPERSWVKERVDPVCFPEVGTRRAGAWCGSTGAPNAKACPTGGMIKMQAAARPVASEAPRKSVIRVRRTACRSFLGQQLRSTEALQDPEAPAAA